MEKKTVMKDWEMCVTTNIVILYLTDGYFVIDWIKSATLVSQTLVKPLHVIL